MDENGFMDGPGINGSVGDLLHAKSKRGLVSVDSDATIIDAVEMLKNHNFSQAPVMRDGNLMGILTEKSLLHHAIKGNAQREKVKELVDMDFCVVHANTELYVLTELFSRFKTALVYDDAHQPTDIITRIDLIDHMARSSKR
jgi:cystathionine beta-synthase